MTRIIIVAVIGLPFAAQADDNAAAFARGTLAAKGIKCEQTGMVTDGERTLITCANGQKYAVVRVEGGGYLLRFNQLTNDFEPVK
jgi:hypothetical protein